MTRYLRIPRKDSPTRYHIWPGTEEYNGCAYLGPALIDGEPVNLNHPNQHFAKRALDRLHTDPAKRGWVIYDVFTRKKIT